MDLYMQVPDGAEHAVITEAKQGLFRFLEIMNYAHLQTKCTLQYFNKST
jgi:hypothetical protein